MAICSSATPSSRASSTLPSNQALQVVDDVVVLAPGPVDPRRPLDVHQHVAAAALRDQPEHLLRAAGDVVDRARAPAASARRATSGEKVSAEIGTAGRRFSTGAQRQPLDRRHQRRRLVLGAHRRARLRRHRAHVEHLEAGLDQRQPVGHGLLRRAAPRPLEHRVDGDVDDPRRQRLRQVEGPVGEPPSHRRYRSGRDQWD